MSARSERYHVRDVLKCIRSRKYARDDSCPICLESLSRGDELMATVCNHLMHADCWNKYVVASNMRLLEDDPDINALTLLTAFFNRHAGPQCPVCRHDAPTLHYLTLAIQEKRCMDTVEAVCGFNLDTALQLASVKRSA